MFFVVAGRNRVATTEYTHTYTHITLFHLVIHVYAQRPVIAKSRPRVIVESIGLIYSNRLPISESILGVDSRTESTALSDSEECTVPVSLGLVSRSRLQERRQRGRSFRGGWALLLDVVPCLIRD